MNIWRSWEWAIFSDNLLPWLIQSWQWGGKIWQLAATQPSLICLLSSCPEHQEESEEDSCKFSIKTDAGLRTHTITFRPGEWVEDVTMDGRKIKSLFQRTGNRLVEWQVGEMVNTTLVREFYRDRLVVNMMVNNVNASSLFLRKWRKERKQSAVMRATLQFRYFSLVIELLM